MMKKFLILLVLISISVPLWAKYPNPFVGRIVPEQKKIAVGRNVPLTLTLETKRPFKLAQVAIKLSPGVTLVSGKEISEITDFKLGEKKIFNYTVKVKEKGEQKITISAKALGLGPNEAWSNSFVSTINPEPVKDNSKIMTDSDGVKIIVNE